MDQELRFVSIEKSRHRKDLIAGNKHCPIGVDVTVWTAIEKEIDEFSVSCKHANLTGMEILKNIVFTEDLRDVRTEKTILLFAVPSVFVHSTTRAAKTCIVDGQIIVDVAKGIEADTLYTITQVIRLS